MSFRAAFLLLVFALASAVLAEAQQPASSPRSSTPDASSGEEPVTPGAERREVPAGPRTIVSNFFSMLEKGLVDDAYSKLTEGSKISQNTEQSTLIRKKTVEAIEAFGQIKGFELIEMEWAGTHLVRLTYISLGENFPLRWRFYFYQREQTWRLVDIRVDDSLKDLFQERGESEDDS